MYNSDTEILFPLRVAGNLSDLRGPEWSSLVDRIGEPTASKSEKIGFVLMMIRLNGCIACNADSFRAMRGCTQCTRQTIRRYRSADNELLDLFHSAVVEAEQYILKQDQEKFIR